jgi:CheY-like chemotaxis protein
LEIQENKQVEDLSAADTTILLVEDEDALLELNRRMLLGLGYTVLSASTTTEAIRLAREHAQRIDLLLTDVVMPEMNGRDLAQRLQTFIPNLQLVFMSGYTADVIAHHGVLDQGVHFLKKPFSKRELGLKLLEVLTESGSNKQD